MRRMFDTMNFQGYEAKNNTIYLWLLDYTFLLLLPTLPSPVNM